MSFFKASHELSLLFVFQALITCPCKVLVQAPTSPQTCPVALWICPPAAMAQWVVTITPSLLPRACQRRAKWTWPKASPWETTGLGQTWTCSPIKVKKRTRKKKRTHLFSLGRADLQASSPVFLVFAAHHSPACDKPYTQGTCRVLKVLNSKTSK